ncbi:MAG TPA: C40 family peptidase [Longimicrobiales bacterium]|nr:C40 family peptidase [Longimicrobiales bacterium]
MRRLATLLVLALPAPLPGQTSVSFGPFVGVNGAVEGSPAIAGLAVQPRWGVLGVRVSGSMDAGQTPAAPLVGGERVGGASAWAGDLDLTLAPARWSAMAPLFGRSDPTLFVGAGMHGGRPAGAEAATIPSFSYGAGLRWPLLRWLSLESEARWRAPMQDAASLPPGVAGGLELRAGLTFEIGTRRGVRAPARRPDTSGRSAPTSPSAGGRAAPAAAGALLLGDRYLGVPYLWGGNTPETGFDCSGFVRYVYDAHGVSLPRVSRQQALAGEPLPLRLDALAPGDLMAFAGDGVRVDHIALYAGDGRILHSSKSGQGVRYDDLHSRRGRWYLEHWVSARRVAGGASLLATGGLPRVPLAELDALLGEEIEPVDHAPPPGAR